MSQAAAETLRCAALTDPGRKRENNEDRYLLDPERGVFAVVDGVGGQAAGETAAETAVELIGARLQRETGTLPERIREAITIANNEILRLTVEHPEWSGMACVLTVAIVRDGRLTVGHVGDSRLYVIGEGTIRKVTSDHSPVGELEDNGALDEAHAMAHPRRNEVYRDVGSATRTPHDEGFIDISELPFSPRQAILMCSDGLSDLVTSSVMLSLVESHAGEPQAAVRALVDAANEASGKDNVTVIVVEGAGFAHAVRSLPNTPGDNVPAAADTRWLPGILVGLACGLMIAAALFWYAEPHWLDRAAGRVFGTGSVRLPRTIMVGADSSHPYSTISKAVADARAGDTVLVAPGIYREQIRLKDGVNLRSEQPLEATIESEGIAIAADGIKRGQLSGFRVSAPPGGSLRVGLRINNSDLEATDLEVTGAQVAGVELAGTSGGALQASRIRDNPGVGVRIGDQAITRVVHNTIAGNGKPGVPSGPISSGVTIGPGAMPFIAWNTIVGNVGDPPPAASGELLKENYFGTSLAPPAPVPIPAAPKPTARRTGRSKPRRR